MVTDFPCARSPVSKDLSSAVSVCVAESSFVTVIFVPGLTSNVAGWKAKSLMVTFTSPFPLSEDEGDAEAGAETLAEADGSEDAETEADAGGVLLVEDPSLESEHPARVVTRHRAATIRAACGRR
jgi:hypothetical protein